MAIAEEHRLSGWNIGERNRVRWALIAVQVGFAGNMVLCKSVLNDGDVKPIVYAAHRDLVALLVLAPIAYFAERHKWTAVTWRVYLHIILLGFIGIDLRQLTFLGGLYYTNPLVAASMLSAIPVFSSVIAAICGIEIIRFKEIDGIAKVTGIVVCVFGALTMSLYKGPKLLGSDPVLPPVNLGYYGDHDDWLTSILLRCGADYWQIGSLYMILCALCTSIYINLQIPALRLFPAPVSLTTGSVLVGGVGLYLGGLLTVSNASQWFINKPRSIVAVAYGGIIATAFTFALSTWANHKVGPTLVTLFAPLKIVFSTLLGLVVNNDAVYLGSLIGACFIVAGLYGVTWARRTHERAIDPDALAKPFGSVYDQDVRKPLLLT